VAYPPSNYGKLSLPPHNLPHNTQHQLHNHPPSPPAAVAVFNSAAKLHNQSSTYKPRQQDFISLSSSTVTESTKKKNAGGIIGSHQRERGITYSFHTLLYCTNYFVKLDCISSDDSESIAQAQEKIALMVRQREEAKLKHIAQMHKIEEDQEKKEQQNAEARADIKNKRDAADIETVSITII
jgi:hypothetical protein